MLGKKKSDPTQSGHAKSGQTKQAPISSHPVFPVVVALWFAALLGVGSLLLPVVIFEKFATATGLASISSAAQPPLGTTARLIIAVIAAAAGAIAGIFIARKVAQAQSSASPVKRQTLKNSGAPTPATDDSAKFKKPISAHEELGENGLDAPLTNTQAQEPLEPGMSYHGKRRSLAVTDDSGPSEYLESAPLPGGAVNFDGPSFDAAPDAPEPLDLADLALDESPVAASFDDLAEEFTPDMEPQEIATPAPAPAPTPAPTPAMSASPRPFDTPAFSNSDTGVDFQSISDQEIASPAEVLRQEFPLKDEPAQPVSQSAPESAYSPFSTPADDFGEFQKPFETPAAELPEAPLGLNLSSDMAVAAETQQQLTDLSMAELVERFALALQTKARTERTAAHVPEAPAEALAEVPAGMGAQPSPLVFRRANPTIAVDQPIASPAAASALSASLAAPVSEETHEEVRVETAAFMSAPVDSALVDAGPVETGPVEATLEAKPAEPKNPVPFALRPFAADDDDDDSDDEVDNIHGLSLSLSSSAPPMSKSVRFSPFIDSAKAGTEAEAPPSFTQAAMTAAPPVPTEPTFNVPSEAPPAVEASEEVEAESAEEGAYSSLLNMKSQFSAGQEFVRIDDDETSDSAPESVVVFPGQDQRRASPAADGPTRDPVMTDVSAAATHRPFDSPAIDSRSATGPALAASSNPGETERALREALEKLQKMSGAA